jgi:hypothetical protein
MVFFVALCLFSVLDGLAATAQIRSTESEWNLALKEAALAAPPVVSVSHSSNPLSASGHSTTASRLPSGHAHSMPMQHHSKETVTSTQESARSLVQTGSQEQESWNTATSSENGGWAASGASPPAASPLPAASLSPSTGAPGATTTSAHAVALAPASVTATSHAAGGSSGGVLAVGSSPSGQNATTPSGTHESQDSGENSASAHGAAGNSEDSSLLRGNTVRRGPNNTIVRQIHIPIIACTASAMDSDAEACRTAGMDAFLLKPISINDLKAKLKHVAFRWQHAQRQLRRLTRQTLNAAMATQTTTAPTTVQEGEEGHADSQAHVGLYSTPSPQ